MRSHFDPRVVPEAAVALVRDCQARVPCRLAGGAALSGAWFAHRLTGDFDLFCRRREDVRRLADAMPEAGAALGIPVALVRDSGAFVRFGVVVGDQPRELDLVHDTSECLAPPPPAVDGVVVESLPDLRANKLTCILSRSEPRDLVDLLFLDRAGFPPERDLELARRKDAGIDPGILAWLLGQFPVRPLPLMIEPLTEGELGAWRDELRQRFRAIAIPPSR